MNKLDSLIEKFEKWVGLADKSKNYRLDFDSFVLRDVYFDLRNIKKEHEEELFKMGNFVDDEEKMKDFRLMAKEEFLLCYGYLTEQEYDNTERIVKAVLDVYEH